MNIAAAKQYKAAPLPFNGQKRAFVTPFRKALEKYPKNAIYVDLFGGSGLLAHTIKSVFPDAKVVYNDFDNYTERLQNITQTNELLKKISLLLAPLKREKKLENNDKQAVISLLKQQEKEGKYIDWITVSGSILFTMKFAFCVADLEKETFYNNSVSKEYNASGYLEGVEVVREDYKALIEKYKDIQNVVFIADPPYLSTDNSGYKGFYWKLTDYLDILTMLNKKSFIYFTSSKSQIVELCEWIKGVSTIDIFKNATTEEIVKTGHQIAYTDYMIHKQVN